MVRLNASFAFLLGIVTLYVVTITQEALEAIVPGFEAWFRAAPLLDPLFVPAWLVAATLMILLYMAYKRILGKRFDDGRVTYAVGAFTYLVIGAVLYAIGRAVPNLPSPVALNIPPIEDAALQEWVAKQGQFYVPALAHLVFVVVITWLGANWATAVKVDR